MFVAVVKPMSYKYLFTVEIKRGYQIPHMDIVIAFVYGFLNEVIYMEQLYLFTIELKKVCKLIKALYRLKQIPHIWYKALVKFLKKLRLIQLELDHRLFVSTNKQLFIAIYVDNLLIFGLYIINLKDVQ